MPTPTPAPPAESAAGRRVAYVMNAFPRLSETFIAHEIHQLERQGLALRLFAIKREPEPQVHPVVRAIRAPVEHLPAVGSLSGSTLPRWLAAHLGAYWRAHAAVVVRHPLRWGGVLASALALSWRHRGRDADGRLRLRKVFVKEFVQAGHIAAELLRDGHVAHLHGHFCHGVATVTWFASRMSGVPYSFTAHARDIYEPDLNPGRLLERKLAGARFVATCTCANAEVLRRRHARPEEVHTIYHGLDTDAFRPPAERPRSGPPLILAVGRFVEKKGFEHLVQACALLRDAGHDFRCEIVGEHGPALAAVQARVRALDLRSQVRLHGPVTQDALRDIYARAHVFALPCLITDSGDRDGFPNVLAEAMAMGVPVVTSPISGIPEMIDDGEHGLLVDPRDTRALAAALARLLRDPALHAGLAQRARQRMIERFDSRRTTLALRDLFAAQLATTECAPPRAAQEARA